MEITSVLRIWILLDVHKYIQAKDNEESLISSSTAMSQKITIGKRLVENIYKNIKRLNLYLLGINSWNQSRGNSRTG